MHRDMALRLSLEQVMETLDDYNIEPMERPHTFGLYDPFRKKLYYNPRMIASEEEFLLTMLHEITHNVYDGLGELVTEWCAENTLEDEEVKSYLKGYFSEEIGKYWK